MPLEIRPLEEADIAEVARIQMAAFWSGPGITTLLTPNPPPEGAFEKTCAKHLKAFRDEPDIHYIKVVDTDLDGKMIACAKWRINEKERTEEQLEGMLPVPGPDEEGNPGLQDFMRFLHRVRVEFMGTKPFYFLHMVVTDPDHHRRGAGAMLVRWGTSQADNAELPTFLEATETGKPLYLRLGFKPKHEEVWDLTKYGLKGTDKTTVMIRDPQPLAN